MNTFRLAALAACMSLLLAACGGSGGDPLAGTSWRLIAIDDSPVTPGRPITASFADGQVSGSSGCNSYGGVYTVRGDRLTTSDLSTTLMACPEPGVMDQEAAYVSILSSAQTFTLSDGQLLITGAGGDVLRFVPGP